MEKREEKECYNCKYLEFDLDLCTQFFCKYHEKLIKQDDSCENWLKKRKILKQCNRKNFIFKIRDLRICMNLQEMK